MRLDKLLNEVDAYDRPAASRKLEISAVTDMVQDVVPGTLFCCVVGSRADGHDFAREAVERGAVALLVERDVDADVPQIRVSNVRASLALVSAALYDHPSKNMRLVGVTGTNGKTTTTHVLAAILRAHNWETATIGTLSGSYTSPPAPQLQKMLAEFRSQRVHAVVMEVSSHALDQHRVDGIRFRAGVFTNLSQDHLDYHQTMDAYFEAKAALFDPGRCDKGVINVDDPYGQLLVDRTAVTTVEFSLEDAEDLSMGPNGSSFMWEQQPIKLPLVGRFNVYNALAAATTARTLGVPPTVIAEALNNVSPVPGRLERIVRGQPFAVYVDFAHTPDGLQSVLEVARSVARNESKVIVVFGCGGDRDREKRPLMGAVAEQHAQQVFVTTDNARSEAPADIANQILKGMSNPTRAHVELDREAAIRAAMRSANAGDVVVIAGKGHETTQEINGDKRPFDDRKVAVAAIEAVRP